jgi:hypothetical protein
MITFTLVTLGFLMVAAAVALLYAAGRAPEGYEGELGFHEGAEPRPQELTKLAAPVSSNRVRPRRCSPRATIFARQR